MNGSQGAIYAPAQRLLEPVAAVAKDIVSAGGSAEVAEVNAVDEQAVDAHLQSVMERAGRVDVSFNAVGIPDKGILGVPLVEHTSGHSSGWPAATGDAGDGHDQGGLRASRQGIGNDLGTVGVTGTTVNLTMGSLDD